ncbi:indolepyruvate ferredoxin oxidoreductase family protein [soil metagenome]
MSDRHRQLDNYELADRYRAEDGRVFVSGVQAIARLPIDQIRIDARAGHRTAAFVSGYQGSPLAAFGDEVERAARTVPDLPVTVQPGVNEELAATAVMGSQLASTLPDCRYEGVMGMWYGKAPGLDRACDAIRHGVFAGTSPLGGVVAVVGDDPAAKSSTLPSSSDATFVDLHMPVLFPGDVQEALDLSRHAVALSRASGLWAGFKVVTPVADGIGTIDVHPDRIRPEMPITMIDGEPFVPHPSGKLLTPYTLDMEREFVEVRSDLVRRYGVMNGLNRVTVSSGDDWIGIAASGHTFHEVREALELLGLVTDHDLQRAGVRLFHLLMPVPVDAGQVREFAHGLSEVLVIEEKNPTLERLVRDSLYDSAERPRVTGRLDVDGRPLVPGTGTLVADTLLEPLRRRLATRLDDRLRPLPEPPRRSLIPLAVDRTPFYCSGCPHNASTRADADTLVGGGIGCHAMVALMEPERVGDIVGLTAMGGEGAQWIGISPFIDRKHLVQNLGDGTYFHSGSLAVRAAVASGIDITYKLLHNGTVAMTGGQNPAGQIGVPGIVKMLLLEGVKRVIVTTDDVGRHDPDDFPAGVDIWDRTRLEEAQQVLADVAGTTVLLHDQACAAENRRARSRGTMATPGFRVVINERVCEGCGDCGAKSNCLSVQPIDTPWGRKTHIHQTSCNFDFSCLEGDCPAFATVTLTGDATAGPRDASVDEISLDGLPDPVPVVDPDRFTVRLSGIGGTGVVTVSQILGTAAMLAGRSVRGLDQTGLSQKAGPVVSDLRITADAPTSSNHANAAGVDCMLGFDLLVAASDTHRLGAAPDRTVVIASTTAVPTGQMVTHPETAFPTFESLRGRMDEVSRPDLSRYVDAAAVTEGLFGATTTSNIFMLGVAVQAGAVPVDPEHLERAIGLNGVAVDRNVAAFRWGRRWVVDPDTVHRAAGLTDHVAAETLDELTERLAVDITDYQSTRYADRFRSTVERARRAEQEVDHESEVFTDAVARNLHKLMAYKDEYEVARLLLLDESRAGYEAVGGRRTSVTHHLHPPVLRALGMQRKLKLRRTARPLMKLLRAAKGVRGTLVDPFRWDEVRRVERAMIPEYIRAVERLSDHLTAHNIEESTAIAWLPDQVRGYESLKLRRAAVYRDQLAARLP